MGSFGERLRREREMRGISLDNIAESTKIGTRLLRALEEEQFELLPGGIFNKGFVRAYAKYLGLNEDEAVTEYLIAAGESSLDPRAIAEQNDSRIDRLGGDPGNSRVAGFPIIPVLILLIVIAAGLGGWRIYRDRVQHRAAKVEASDPAPGASRGQPALDTNGAGDSNNPARTTAPESTSVAPDAKVAENAGSIATTSSSPVGAKSAAGGATTPPAAAKTSSSTGEPFEVTVRAMDHAWVSIKTDGRIAVRGVITPPDVKTVRATDQVVFWTGNAGAVEISFNGQRVALEGGPNTAGTLVFNSHGVVIPKPAAATREP